MYMLIDATNDIHTDLWKTGVDSVDWNKIRNPGSDVLVLAGDTSNYIHELEIVLYRASKVYKHVFFTDGNHEHYFWNSDVFGLEKYLTQVATQYPNVTYLNGTNSTKIDDTVFIGCNGWYDFKVGFPRWSHVDAIGAWYKFSNDSKMIDFGPYSATNHADRHSKMLVDRVTALQGTDSDVVICTHTVPHPDFTKWSAYTNTPQAILDGAYYNTGMKQVFDADQNQLIKVWLFGHTHQRFDRQIGHVRYLNNARGYECERDKSSKWFLVQVDTKDKGYG